MPDGIDALVIFGATGDLAKLETFPALVGLVDRVVLDSWGPAEAERLLIHIGFLTGYRSRLGAVLSWWLAFTRDMRRERTFTTREVGVVRDVYSGEPS